MDETQREKFEAWADVKYPLVNKLRAGDPLRCYSVHMKSCAWDGWQAARASPVDTRVEEPVAEIESYTSGSYWRNYKVRWLRDVPEGTKLYDHPASLPAPTDEHGLPVKWTSEDGTHEISIDYAAEIAKWVFDTYGDVPEVDAALRARPAEPTPSVDVLRQEERRDRVILAAKAVSYSNGFDAALPEKKAELYAALKALEKP